MSRRTFTTLCAVTTAVFLLAIGTLHGIVNVSMMQRAVARGEIAARLGQPALANAAFSGVAIAMLGLLVLIVLPGLRAGARESRRVAAAIGILVGLIGLVGYVWSPSQPRVLVFFFFGVLLAAPALTGSRGVVET